MKLGEYVDDYGIMVYSFRNDIDDDDARIILKRLKRTGLFKDKTKRSLLSYKIVSFLLNLFTCFHCFIFCTKVYFNIGGVIIVVKITTITIAVK